MECGDCYWRISGGCFDERCQKHGKKKVEFDTPACSDFLSYETPACSDCRYYEFTTFAGKCTLYNKKISGMVMSPPACRSFCE